MLYDVVIVGAGPGGIYAAYKLKKENKDLKIAIIEKGNSLDKRNCPLAEGKVDKCIECKPCNIMSGFSGSGFHSDSKFNITNDFGGNLWEKIGKEKSLKLQKEVDKINKELYNKEDYPKLFSSKETTFKKACLKNDLHLMDADIRHLGTDKGQIIVKNLYERLVELGTEFIFNKTVFDINRITSEFSEDTVYNIEYSSEYLDEYSTLTKPETIQAKKVIISAGRSGSKWLEKLCKKLNIKAKSNRVDLGVRVELPYEVFSHLTEELYESKIVYRTKSYNDLVRTFCMNPHGIVVNENTNGIMTVNGHSYEDKSKHTNNTNFALLVSQEFTEPFNSSNEYGESIAKLSNMLGGGVIVQRFGDLIRYRRSNTSRMASNTVNPTLKAIPGDLSLVLPHRILEDIKEMIYQLDLIAPGTKNDDTLLYGVEVKFYNNSIEVNENLEADKNLFIIGDGSGWTHSLSQAAASGLYVGEYIASIK